ncbi:hypothetical protein [Prochlorothrix hollandica]|uniref:F420-0:Gamma-glutamyl ligase n=1 Tax=Prochlorothrix hollandica PCC 9006 = CALU 1027 TaxID=317619 RepID=A0A0M2PQ12_PROHO|nr:hypothetical protein [Prochlorothrix hollandica]KKI98319.1 F420-0:Gamma-glutamyl ligase [Prochlorothrix hollandica PCC 9006 = CALU 1027]
MGVLGAAAALGAFEWQYRQRPGNALEVTQGTWELESLSPTHRRLVGHLALVNRTRRLEIMVPELEVKTKIFSKGSLDGVRWHTSTVAHHEDMPNRADGYWFAYIVKVAKSTNFTVTLDLEGEAEALDRLQSAWMRVDYTTYGPEGRIPKTHHGVIPLNYPDANASLTWKQYGKAEVLPVPTHLLTAIDDPVAVVQRYVLPQCQPGDIVTLGETPVAIMQGRFRHPSTIRPGWVARHLCYYFLPTSSLATACGMQALVDVSGPVRVVAAFLGGVLLRLVGQRGGFYQLAGEQARLIDDVTGTLPPYDQFIVLGPADPQGVVDRVQRETGLACAIVDVNDLRAVKILASSSGVSDAILTEALLSNPAGNADEQTPVVLVRPQG